MRILWLILLMASFAPTQAAIEAYQFKTVQMEADYTRLINELRCLVCQNQNIASSNADLANDLREQTYEMLMQGNTPEQVMEFMVARYGDFVLYRPPLKTSTLLLWLGPFIFLIVILVLVIQRMRRKQDLAPPDEAALARAKQLLSDQQD